MRYTVLIVFCLALIPCWIRVEYLLAYLPLKLQSHYCCFAANQNMAVYDQFILFGDSLIQHSSSQDRGFSLTPALQSGMCFKR